MTTADAPAIRFTDYMGGYEEMNAVNLIGPYPTVADRNADLDRLRTLPLGGSEFTGGHTFDPATMADARGEPGWDLHVVDPARVARVSTQRDFHEAFYGYDTAAPADPHEPHSDQAALFR
jgi:hypothetical protein